MATEIERKFLVDSAATEVIKKNCSKYEIVQQGYLRVEKDIEIRVYIGRESDCIEDKDYEGDAYLAVKIGNGVSRQEYEQMIDVEAARILLWRDRCHTHIIEKTRYYFDKWEIDIFDQNHYGLILCEIELESEDEAFTFPEWLSKFIIREVTLESEYKNKNLAILHG